MIRICIVLLVCLLTGCASYQPKPLNMQPTLLHQVPHLVMDTNQISVPQWTKPHLNHPNGLTMEQVATLAVANNPDLILARDDVGVAQAQAFAAGLLPDPQLNAVFGFPTVHPPGTVNAYSYTLSYDLHALWIRSVVMSQANAARCKVDLTLLWQEWQTASQARLLFVRNIEQQRMMRFLQQDRAIIFEHYRQTQMGVRTGNTTIDVASADVIALGDITQRINDLARLINQNHHDLNLLLGLAPEVNLPLAGDLPIERLNKAKVAANLQRLAYCRPDLLALKAGYESQDARYRQAIIEQFPAINLGLTYARDDTNITYAGFGLSMNLPIFNRNRGNVAIEQATRQRLYDDFQNRLNSAYSDIETMLVDQKLMENQLLQVKHNITLLQQMLTNARAKLKNGSISASIYNSLRLNLLDTRIKAIILEQNILEQRVALQTLLGGELPT
ncbi:MAG: TolC family protein, partial [Gammaproteobacteria bacterium]